ncbi:serine/threonine-protein kinase [Streptomyces sp. SP18CS02]|uniref:serine/threonine-protein kinase n=1 Tax=Streptomyces sp. SP18CS02 TaxID=3002531 RepID=UPI002E788774|nr:protein kinase [Streptomyces sp. SP18CS02]MEE1751827.1 protein kinase [Streptomyces sp. SP18CS02]
MQPLEAGEPRAIGPYRLLGRLGAGGMGRVYLARSAGGRTVAVKVVHPHFALDEEFRARFRREVDAARRVGGRWTAPVLDADPEAPIPWVATGYVAGPALARAVTDHGPLPGQAVRVLGAGLAEALAAVHALGLVHRDVKPSNVLLALDGPRLIDFGIARAGDSTASLTSTGVSVGSPGYMAPEQILGKGVTGAADVFSLGAVLAYAATGTSPFPGDSSAALLYKVVHEEPELGGALTGEVRGLVAACLDKDPAGRPSPGEVARGLAPGGAAPAASAGWLPPPLVEQVSRAAVRLLDLEPADPEPAGSGPVPFSSPAVGVFGPPLDAPLPAGADGFPTPDPVLAARPPAGPGTVPPAAWGPGPGPTAGADPVPGPRTPLSLSVSTTAETTAARGRRLSCTVALAVAGALAAVTAGGAVLLDLVPGGGADGRKSGGVAAQPPGRSTGPSGPSDTAPLSAVPEEFTGTWKGPFKVRLAGSEIAAGTFTVVVTGGGPGSAIGTVVQYDALGAFTCEDRLVLRSATKGVLVADGSASDRPGNHCTGDAHRVTLKLKGAQLTYASDEARAGNPYATLDRAG